MYHCLDRYISILSILSPVDKSYRFQSVEIMKIFSDLKMFNITAIIIYWQ